jgi:peptidoglycan hydrolase-like protein with peptidoglycan-binding domain
MERTLRLTTPHMTGDDVKQAQKLLKKAGYYDARVGGEFGPLTAQASYRAQYWLGYAKPQQTFGNRLENFLLRKTKPTPAMRKRIAERKKGQKKLRLKALARMKKLVGICERPAGSNHVPEINGWWGGGNEAWCARCVSKAYVQAGSAAFVRGRNYSYVPFIVQDARAGRNGLTVTVKPKAGDLVCFDWDGSNFATDKNHVGMFVSGTKSRFKTIEANVDSRCGQQNRTSKSAPRIVFVHASR